MATAAHDAPQDRIVLLDILRLFAALMVVAFHWLFRGPASGDQLTAFPGAVPFAAYGYIGVDWFFVISGFVIAWTAEGRTAAEFAVMRFCRLYPAFIACMTVTFLMALVYKPDFFSPDASVWLANLTMFAPILGKPFMDGAYWSIAVEIIFYGWVFAALATGLWQHRFVLAFVWLALSVADMVFLKSNILHMALITEFAPWFIMGLMIHDVWRAGWRFEQATLLVAAFIAACLSLMLKIPDFAADYGFTPDPAVLFGMNLLGVGLILICIGTPVRNHRIAAAAALAGALSYPLYLIHQHAGYMLIDRIAPLAGKPLALTFAALAVLSIALSTTMLIEKPLRPMLKTKLQRTADRLAAVANLAGRQLIKRKGG